MSPSWGSGCVWSRTVPSRNSNHINIVSLWLSMHLGMCPSLSVSPLLPLLLSFFTQRFSLCIHMRMMSAIKMRTVIMRWTVSHVKITVSSLALSRVLIWSNIDVILLRPAEYDVTHHKHYLDVCQYEHCTYNDLSPTYAIEGVGHFPRSPCYIRVRAC